MTGRADTQPDVDFDDHGDSEGFCKICGDIWDQCEHFFENWICGMMPDGSCSLAGTEECDWECPRGGLA